MLNVPPELKGADLHARAAQAIRNLLERIRFLGPPENLAIEGHGGPDLRFRVPSAQGPWTLVCEVKQSAQPRYVHGALYQLKEYARSAPGPTYPVLVAPYISPNVRKMCQEADVGFLDFWGNCYLAFDHVFVERTGNKADVAERRELRSLFGTKSTRILRLLLREPQRQWKVVELAERARVSVGQVSNVRAALLSHEWAEVGPTSSGIRITKPDAVLDAWRDVYRKLRPQRLNYYTLLHGDALVAAARRAFGRDRGESAIFCSFSAAQWLAPFARVPTHRFLATEEGEAELRRALELEPIGKGENVVIERPKDDGVFDDRVEAAPGLWCTSPIQTYLDLSVAGERGREAAEHLRMHKIQPQWQGVI